MVQQEYEFLQLTQTTQCICLLLERMYVVPQKCLCMLKEFKHTKPNPEHNLPSQICERKDQSQEPMIFGEKKILNAG